MSFKKAHEVADVAEEIIKKHHPHLVDAIEKGLIGFYFKSGNNDWAGKAKKCTAFERFTTGCMLFVFIDNDAWKVFNEKQKEALVDHELCHFTRMKEEKFNPDTQKMEFVWADAEDPDNWKIREHDVEEFSDVIVRHGLWETGIERFALAVRNADHQISIEDYGLGEESEPRRRLPFTVEPGGIVNINQMQ